MKRARRTVSSTRRSGVTHALSGVFFILQQAGAPAEGSGTRPEGANPSRPRLRRPLCSGGSQRWGNAASPVARLPFSEKQWKTMSWRALRLAEGLWLVHLRGDRLVLHMPSPSPHLPKRPATSAQGTSRSMGGDGSSASSASSATSNARTNPASQETGAAQTGASTGQELSVRGR